MHREHTHLINLHSHSCAEGKNLLRLSYRRPEKLSLLNCDGSFLESAIGLVGHSRATPHARPPAASAPESRDSRSSPSSPSTPQSPTVPPYSIPIESDTPPSIASAALSQSHSQIQFPPLQPPGPARQTQSRTQSRFASV